MSPSGQAIAPSCLTSAAPIGRVTHSLRSGTKWRIGFNHNLAMIEKGVAVRAGQDLGLFTRTAAHRDIYFNWSWMDYTTLRRGMLQILPREGEMAEWRRDYQAMREEMFFGTVPSFEEIMRVVGDFERSFNVG